MSLWICRVRSRGTAAAIRKAVTAGMSVAFALSTVTSGFFPTVVHAKGPHATPKASSQSECRLQSAHGDIQRVIYIQFDNVHFRRDNPSVPSDLEQMPHLLNFFVNNGTLSSNHHTSLISHTADDILTSLTGVYGDRLGQPVSNSYNYFDPTAPDGLGSIFTTSFTYWTN